MVSSTLTNFQSETVPPSSEPLNQAQQSPPTSAVDVASNLPESAGNTNNGDAAAAAASIEQPTASVTTPKWPGWPGDNVFRLVVPVLKVGSIIGRKGELVKKMCEESRARIRILEGPLGNADRIVLISGREDPDAPLSPAMDATLRVFKRVSGLSSAEESGAGSTATMAAFCSLKLLVAASQAVHLIGKQGSTIKLIQESSGASVRVLTEDELPAFATSDERIVEIHGEALKVLRALEAVLGQLRKFLVDHSVLPIFEKTYNSNISQDRAAEPWTEKPQASYLPASVPVLTTQALSEFSLPIKRDPYLLDHETSLDTKHQRSSVSLFGQDPVLHGLRSSISLRAAPVVTQMTKIMQVPLSYAEDIIGIGGTSIAYIRRTSGAILSVQESRGLPDEITIEIKGTSSQVQTAEQLIQEFMNKHKEPASSMYGKAETGHGSFSRFPDYSSSSYQPQPLGGYGSSSLGGYGGFRY
ncbi:RNA-binding KH domain-containing protein PEPPER-like [Ipomoea triloba]|uniref:RNA-binding KH domain-containing protein PEPPER-like n=1 Tax=Ipomoea triloba TaxID=35885 RepID=UPI00125E602F|nr:RNA-binding KH domain-containing protein PEPPER-like [Ipomoea triloba]GLL49939.1 RNA-binding KH domain-containing protein PEPPER-like [Ipomoea trifida]GMD95640.1 RNA-binding KH domain-containing protein PEPPER-like [Ipomoea batatas]GMD97074.1 RNA-binding KH domain-containing protein PEPPER-like [Ipomoea batatas]